MGTTRELTKEDVEHRVQRVINDWVDHHLTSRGTGPQRIITVDDHDTRELARRIVNHDFTKED